METRTRLMLCDGTEHIELEALRLERPQESPNRVYQIVGAGGQILRERIVRRRFDNDYMVKWVPMRHEAEHEVDCLGHVSRGPYFFRFPWVHPKVCRGWEVGDSPGYLVILEYISAPDVLTHFRAMRRGNLDRRLVLLQFCEAFIQMLETVHHLHQLTPPVFHCDVQPENIRFHNNLLKIIDFEWSRLGLSSAMRTGSARYLASHALKARRAGIAVQCLGLIDLQSVIATFLEVLVDVFHEELTPRFDGLAQAVKAKREVESGANREALLLVEQEKIEEVAAEWLKGSNALLRLFGGLAIGDDGTDAAYAKCRDLSNVSIQDLYQTTSELLGPDTYSLRITSETRPDIFAEQMERLLASPTANIFASVYPWLYLYYSEVTGWYDEVAEKASVTAREMLGERTGKDPTLDVGSGFGTAAFQAAMAGFRDIYLLDNSPLFARIAALLWSDDEGGWRDAIATHIGPELSAIVAVCEGLENEEAAHEFIINVLATKRAAFTPFNGQIKGFLLADYWSLNERLFAGGMRFQYIVCNNVLHWPVIGLDRLRMLIGPEYEWTDRRIPHLLVPLLKNLARPGVLAIIEPSLFMKDDTDPEDDSFHGARFNLTPIYRSVHRYVYTDLLPRYFKINAGRKWPGPRADKFRVSALKAAIDAEYPQCSVSVRKFKPKRRVEWRPVILGEFMMALRLLGEEAIRNIWRAGPNVRTDFYRALADVVDREIAENTGAPGDCCYIAYVTRGVTHGGA